MSKFIKYGRTPALTPPTAILQDAVANATNQFNQYIATNKAAESAFASKYNDAVQSAMQAKKNQFLIDDANRKFEETQTQNEFIRENKKSLLDETYRKNKADDEYKANMLGIKQKEYEDTLKTNAVTRDAKRAVLEQANYETKILKEKDEAQDEIGRIILGVDRTKTTDNSDIVAKQTKTKTDNDKTILQLETELEQWKKDNPGAPITPTIKQEVPGKKTPSFTPGGSFIGNTLSLFTKDQAPSFKDVPNENKGAQLKKQLDFYKNINVTIDEVKNTTLPKSDQELLGDYMKALKTYADKNPNKASYAVETFTTLKTALDSNSEQEQKIALEKIKSQLKIKEDKERIEAEEKAGKYKKDGSTGTSLGTALAPIDTPWITELWDTFANGYSGKATATKAVADASDKYSKTAITNAVKAATDNDQKYFNKSIFLEVLRAYDNK